MKAIIEAVDLRKSFGSLSAVDGISFQINTGECLGLLGPNGAGKSTLINMAYGASLPTSGELKVFGMNPAHQSRDIKRRLGVVTQDNALDEALTVFENMNLYAAFVGVKKADREAKIFALLDFLALKPKAQMPIRALSGGMKRRLTFVRALLGEPEFVILDEPTTGLDPAVRHSLWEKILSFKAQKKTVLLTTHYMHEAEILCDRILILSRGKIIAEGSPSELIAQHSPGFVGIFHDRDNVFARLQRLAANGQVYKQSQQICVRLPELRDVIKIQDDLAATAVQMRPSNLEDVFIKLTGEGLGVND